eukprot:CAMPEP_0195078900 /NCGR_PEP_ID=MMETSP0448-20130528/20972_1 /TAXON_ID=66468 /ORGANISM="Heterocapsa triquestra, Strain CCMP 448" /LENGTH=99 /DNA_ID=CAMNT_0040111675 /DNA_START=9 /DNA_END=305 /DNA_ORIENTATION=-
MSHVSVPLSTSRAVTHALPHSPSYPRLGDEKVRELDAAEAARARAARQAGHGHPLATVAGPEVVLTSAALSPPTRTRLQTQQERCDTLKIRRLLRRVRA